MLKQSPFQSCFCRECFSKTECEDKRPDCLTCEALSLSILDAKAIIVVTCPSNL